MSTSQRCNPVKDRERMPSTTTMIFSNRVIPRPACLRNAKVLLPLALLPVRLLLVRAKHLFVPPCGNWPSRESWVMEQWDFSCGCGGPIIRAAVSPARAACRARPRRRGHGWARPPGAASGGRIAASDCFAQLLGALAFPSGQRLFRIDDLGLGLGDAAASVPILLLDRCMARLLSEQVKADGARL